MFRSKPWIAFATGFLAAIFLWDPASLLLGRAALRLSPWGWETTITRDGHQPIREYQRTAKIHFLEDASKLRDPTSPFTMKLRGEFHALETGAHRFILRGDDGFRLWVNGELRIDHWGNRAYSGSRRDAVVQLEPGWHQLEIEMHHVDGPPRIKAVWMRENGRRELPLAPPWIRKPTTDAPASATSSR